MGRPGTLRSGYVALSLLAALWACVGPSPPLEEVPHGSWGGEHAALEVDASGAHFELDCAHGRMESALRLDEEGRFEVEGFYVSEAPPIREGSFERRPAAFSGSTDGRRLDFTLTLLDSGTASGSFSVFFGEFPRLVKCL